MEAIIGSRNPFVNQVFVVDCKMIKKLFPELSVAIPS